MDTTSYTATILDRLGDPTGAIYDATAVASAGLAAVREYSQYRPLLRRYGTGALWSAAALGASSVQVIGGGLQAGDALTLDPFTSSQETVTVQSVALAPAAPTTMQPAFLQAVTLAAPLAHSHAAGAVMRKSSLGLAVASGQDTYPLPLDLLRPNRDSFDAAVGTKLSYSIGSGYYDAAFRVGSQYDSDGFGTSSNYGPGGVYGYPIVGNPFYNPAAPSVQPTLYRFLLSDPPSLRITPAPTRAALYDFDYWACHDVSTVPSTDMEACVAFARYTALSARATAINENWDQQDEEARTQVSANVRRLEDQAATSLAIFDRKVRNVPYLTTG